MVLAGGIFRAVPHMRDEVTRRLAARLPNAATRVLDQEPAMGAVRLALRVLAGESVVPTYVDETS